MMNNRNFFLVVGISFILFFIVLQEIFLFPSINKQKEKEAQLFLENISAQVMRYISSYSLKLYMLSGDWAHWDYLHHYLKNRDKTFIKEHFDTHTFKTLKLSRIVVFDPAKKVLLDCSFKFKNKDVTCFINPNKNNFYYFNKKFFNKKGYGFIKSKEGPSLYAFRKILNNNNNEDSAPLGYLLMIKPIGDDELKVIGEIVGCTIKWEKNKQKNHLKNGLFKKISIHDYNEKRVGTLLIRLPVYPFQSIINKSQAILRMDVLLIIMLFASFLFLFWCKFIRPLTILLNRLKEQKDIKKGLSKDLSGDIGALAKLIEELSVEIKKSEERYKILVENALYGIIIHDENRFIYVNPMVEEITGYPAEEIYSASDISFFLHPDFKDKCEIKNGTHLREEIKIITKDGQTKDVVCRKINIVYNEQNAFLLHMVDVTKERSLEKQLLHSQKMESLGTLAGGVAHDFNNLLTGIIGHLSIIKLNIKENSPFLKNINSIESIVMRARDLTKMLLGFAKQGKYETSAVNINKILKGILVIAFRTFGKNIIIKTSLHNDLWSVDGNAEQLEFSFMNILINAKDAMPGGGIIEVKTENIKIDKDNPLPIENSTGDFVLTTISDTGVGMSEKVKERIFEPFFTTKEKGHGTGLGLSMVYGVIKNHGGYIDVESYPGMGTTFSIYIPANHKVKKSKEITPIEEIIHGKGTILVIDDEEVVRDVLKDMLESIGYNVLTAENGKKGLNIYKSNIDIDLVILDLIMPVMSGKETFQELKRINKNVKVLIATGYAKEEHLKEVLEQGALGVIQKPFTLERLSAKINKIITP
ncbi:MAG: hypothetical protein DRG20_06715 [Deltaproteobacteria bacterium]|nr:MAG: hypothetical protein DRG20_06715 [Deltaproteobacteria bacterium]